ncbi:MAG: hypothetical protein M0R00_06680 [Candidatus Omnitrophica bacterium]|jgi:hypothetical protein|nr:hypothetical protein [Candidatus Omnitrophota bacterium]
MKKIINGKVYNTATAECVADEGRSLHNFYSTTEALYRTKKGAWFKHGESSAGGSYSHWSGNSCGYGEDIIALEPDEVLLWAEQADIYDKEKTRIAELLNLPEA